LQVADLLIGLRCDPKRLPESLLYDARGSELFESICDQPEYYPTRTELSILRGCAGELARRLGERVLLVELGSGASLKTRLLLDRLVRPVGYVPIDISPSALRQAVAKLARSRRNLPVIPLCADFTRPIAVPHTPRAPARVAFFFPGSTIGNLDPPAATSLLRGLRESTEHESVLVIGFDLVKDPARLLAAYDDRAGVTAAFNLNVLRRLNFEFGARFDPLGFRHRAVWAAGPSRMEMHLVSRRRQVARLGGERICLAADEPIVTEHSYKFTLDSFERIADASGWRLAHTWTDPARDFAVSYLI
jgi:dimethylhistidine N-methyltransferase